jgi:peptidoglycan LD-endopeptidase CwlK
MWQFSRQSKKHLYTARQELIECFKIALEISPIDFGISCGHRNEIQQTEAFQEGKSQVQWPNSKHNLFPSDAVDFFPYIAGRGAVWTDLKLFYLIAGLVLGVGQVKGYQLRWGGAWNGQLNTLKQFHDLPHIEWKGRK